MTNMPNRRYRVIEGHIKKGSVYKIKNVGILPKAQLKMKVPDYTPIVKEVLEIEGNAVLEQANFITEEMNQAINIILQCNGRVVMTGIGKSGIIARKINATLASTGTPSLFLHPAEGVHGDLGMVREEDVVIAISNSGESAEVLHLLPSLKKIGVKLISIVSNPDSSLGKASDVVLQLAKQSEACSLGLAPTTSTTVTLALGDALAMALLKARNFGPEEFALYHPSGTLGNRLLLTVGELVERRIKNPIIKKSDQIKDAIFTMTSYEAGAISVVDENNQFVAILTDGDIRRAFSYNQNVLEKKVEELCNFKPITVKSDVLASDVLALMKDKKVSVLPVLDDQNKPISILQIQSLIELGL
jgi:arabinose-5-phosphate isomerase